MTSLCSPSSSSLARPLLVGVVVLGCSAAAGCNPIEPRSCTQIGCESGLTVQLVGDVRPPFTITVAEEGGETRSRECPTAGSCDLFFQDFTPGEATVTYQTEGMLVERAFAPEYVRSQPNGEGCPPVCFQATVVLEIPTIGGSPGRSSEWRDRPTS